MGLFKKAKDAASSKAKDAVRDAVSKRAGQGSKLAAAAIGAANAVGSQQAAKAWVNVKDSHWHGPQDEEQDHYRATIVHAAPNFELHAEDGTLLCDVTPRMSGFGEFEQRNGSTVDHVVVKRYEGDYGPYWRVGLFYWDR